MYEVFQMISDLNRMCSNNSLFLRMQLKFGIIEWELVKLLD